jgi:hypothetical protein
MPRDTKGRAKGDETVSTAGLADMRRSNSEKEAVAENMAEKGPEYPHGMRVQLDHDSMKKCGMDSMPEVGSEVHLHAKARVVGARAEGDDHRHLEMQITHLGVHHKPDGMKSQDQAGSGKTPDAGKVTAKKGSTTGDSAKYGRKRH